MLFAAANMFTYWKTLRTVVDPPEPTLILWLISPHKCTSIKDREIDCEGGLLIKEEVALCHHLSYVSIEDSAALSLYRRKCSSFATYVVIAS